MNTYVVDISHLLFKIGTLAKDHEAIFSIFVAMICIRL